MQAHHRASAAAPQRQGELNKFNDKKNKKKPKKETSQTPKNKIMHKKTHPNKNKKTLTQPKPKETRAGGEDDVPKVPQEVLERGLPGRVYGDGECVVSVW